MADNNISKVQVSGALYNIRDNSILTDITDLETAVSSLNTTVNGANGLVTQVTNNTNDIAAIKTGKVLSVCKVNPDATGDVNLTVNDLGAAKKEHSSTDTSYGIGTDTKYGHTKLADHVVYGSSTDTSAAGPGVGASMQSVELMATELDARIQHLEQGGDEVFVKSVNSKRPTIEQYTGDVTLNPSDIKYTNEALAEGVENTQGALDAITNRLNNIKVNPDVAFTDYLVNLQIGDQVYKPNAKNVMYDELKSVVSGETVQDAIDSVGARLTTTENSITHLQDGEGTVRSVTVDQGEAMYGDVKIDLPIVPSLVSAFENDCKYLITAVEALSVNGEGYKTGIVDITIPNQVQYASLPTTATQGTIVQYIGANTASGMKHGYFYEARDGEGGTTEYIEIGVQKVPDVSVSDTGDSKSDIRYITIDGKQWHIAGSDNPSTVKVFSELPEGEVLEDNKISFIQIDDKFWEIAGSSQANWLETDPNATSYIQNKPENLAYIGDDDSTVVTQNSQMAVSPFSFAINEETGQYGYYKTVDGENVFVPFSKADCGYDILNYGVYDETSNIYTYTFKDDYNSVLISGIYPLSATSTTPDMNVTNCTVLKKDITTIANWDSDNITGVRVNCILQNVVKGSTFSLISMRNNGADGYYGINITEL